jgi:ring-1,2-phenylacetyl-CoA epoxidase subunit PaaA
VQQLRPWLDHAPTAEDRWVIARILNEEMRRAWQMTKLLTELDRTDLVEELLWKKQGEHKLESLNLSIETWSDTITYLFYVSGVVAYYLMDFVDSSYASLDRVVGQMIKEERLHRAFSANKITQFVRDDMNRRVFQKLTERWFPRGLDNFGRKNSRADALAVEMGLKKTSNEELRQQYIADILPYVEKWGITLPDPSFDRHII